MEATQTTLLKTYLRANALTEYGQHYAFASITSLADYQRRVPLTTYDDYGERVERIRHGALNVLTTDRVKLFEPSSGSTAASKLIPYTTTLQAEFQRGLAPWIFDLYTHRPALVGGPAYWSISPLTEGVRATPGGIPIGFEDDSAYLGPLGALVETALAVPNAVKHLSNVDTFRYVTLLCLLHCEQLRLISVWNPTFLTLLLAPLAEWWEYLVSDVRRGTVSPPAALPPTVRAALSRRLRPNPRRAAQLQAHAPEAYSKHWPQLSVISCWADGVAARYAEAVRGMFPNVLLQAKGLLATEAFVSFPLVGADGGVLAVRSHFFEFLDERGEPRLAHQVACGQTYSVVVTTGGGLYRYQLRDVVEVVGYVGQAPRLRFVGKADQVSDYFGEKLNEQFVARVLRQLFERYQLAPPFALLAPEDVESFRYVLYIENPPPSAVFALELDDALCANFHYAYCRKLGQIGPVEVRGVAHGAQKYLAACQARGQKLGNIKPSLLQKNTGWHPWLLDLEEAT